MASLWLIADIDAVSVAVAFAPPPDNEFLIFRSLEMTEAEIAFVKSCDSKTLQESIEPIFKGGTGSITSAENTQREAIYKLFCAAKVLGEIARRIRDTNPY